MKVKIVELGENFKAPKPGTLEYEELSNTITDNFKPIFQKLPGYKRIVVDNLQE